MKTKTIHINAVGHRILNDIGVPRKKDGNKLGRGKRRETLQFLHADFTEWNFERLTELLGSNEMPALNMGRYVLPDATAATAGATEGKASSPTG